MGMRAGAIMAAALAALWWSGRALWKRGEKREIVVLSICLLWSAYLIAGAEESWPLITPLSGVKQLLEPLGKIVRFHEWQG
jgi:hypothetical protein